MANVLLDACCLINLWSSGRGPDVLRGLPHQWHVCTSVAAETLIVDTLVDGQLASSAVNLEPHFHSRLLLRCQPEGEAELEAFVRYAARLDDGEAMCLAIARCRSWTVATDERKGRRIAAEDGIATFGTVQLLRHWAEANSLESADVAMVINNVANLGRYRPARDIPDADWWRRNGGSFSK